MKVAWLYQIRSAPGRTAADIIGELTHAAWTALGPDEPGRALDPHRWTALYDLFRRALGGRLVHYAGCGELEECRMGLTSVLTGGPYPAEEWSAGMPALTLETGRPLERLARLLGRLAVRRFRPGVGPERARLAGRAAAAVQAVLAERAYLSAACADCAVRQGPRERRLWPDAAQRGVS